MISHQRARAALTLALMGVMTFALSANVCAQSERLRVAIVRANDGDDRATQVLMRLGAELTAAGFSWVLVDGTNGLAGSLTFRPWALVVVSTAPQGLTIEIGLPATDASGVEARRLISIGASTELTPTELALRTVEVLRAHLEGGPDSPLSPSFSPPANPVVPLRVPVEPLVWQVQAGIGAVGGSQGLQWGLGPAVALVASKASLGVRASMASSLWRGQAQGADSPADVSQWLFMADLVVYLRANNVAVRPYTAIGAGLLRLGVNASDDSRLIATGAARTSAAGKVSVGADVALGTPRLHLVSEAGLLVTSAAMVIEVSGPSAGTAGRPTSLLQIGLSWRW